MPIINEKISKPIKAGKHSLVFLIPSFMVQFNKIDKDTDLLIQMNEVGTITIKKVGKEK